MCELLLDKEADVNHGGIVSKTVWLVCRWMWWGKDIVVVCVCVCVYVDSHLRFQFHLTDLLGKGLVVVCMCVCRQSS